MASYPLQHGSHVHTAIECLFPSSLGSLDLGFADIFSDYIRVGARAKSFVF